MNRLASQLLVCKRIGRPLAWLVAAPLALAIGCAEAPATPSSGGAPPAASASALAPADFAALAVGNAWTYEARSGGRVTTDTVRIIGRDGHWFLDDHRGRRRLDDLGLRDDDRYLLRGPIEVGKSWSSVEQMAVQRFQITSVDAQLAIPGGKFSRCVVVKNEEPLPQGGRFLTEWTWAPQVGLVSVRTRVVGADGKETEQLRLTLMKFEPAAP